MKPFKYLKATFKCKSPGHQFWLKGRLLLLLGLQTLPFLANATVNDYFTSVKNNPNALYSFLKEMPKGGELHYHLAGGAFPETMLALAAKGNYCLDKQTYAMTRFDSHCLEIHEQELLEDSDLYRKTIRAWSLKDFIEGSESNHDHFFAAFDKFLPIVAEYTPQLLAEIIQRAANQHELYLEIQIMPDNRQSASFINQPLNQDQFSSRQQALLADKAFQNTIQLTRSESARILHQARQLLNCDKKPEQEACHVVVKFQYHVLREQSLDKVFAQALNGFAAASGSKEIVGINLVQAEDGPISLRDYHQQMQVFNFLHKLYPDVHISLHAGELNSNEVPPENLRFHIHDAIATGQAQRIGHGVDIAFEDDAEQLLDTMAKNNIAVEVNLTSNKKLLHVAGKYHPLGIYLSHKVPVVLSTDDEGILRTDLTQQYVAAVLEHGIDYATLKTINRNAITYSFLPGQSLWSDAGHAIAVTACKDLESLSCLEFLKKSEKARLQQQLELKLNRFEASFTQ